MSLSHLLGEKFHPLQPQMILAPEFEVCAVGGMGAGKTYAACIAAIRHAMRFPHARVLIARFTYDELIKSTKHLFFEIVRNKGLEKYFVRPKLWDVREGTNYARLTNGSEFFFSNLDRSVDKHKNVEYSFVFIDQLEEIDFEVYQILLLRTRLNVCPPSERHVMGVANDEGDNWIRERFLTYGAPHGRPTAGASRRLVRGTSLQNPHLDAGVRAQFLTLPQEIQNRWVYANMDAGSSRLIPDFRVVEPFEIPAHWPRYVGIDPARSSGVTAAEWVTVNPDGEVYEGVLPNAPHFYTEYWREGRDAEEHSNAIRDQDFPHIPRSMIMDRTSWTASFQSKKLGNISVADLYVQSGLPIIPSSGDAWTRVMLFVNAHRRGLTVSSACPNLMRQGPQYRLKGQMGDTGKPLRIAFKASFHSIDAGGYALSHVPTTVRPVSIHDTRTAFSIRTDIDDGSYRHWKQFQDALPRMRGQSLVTTGYDDDVQEYDQRGQVEEPEDKEDVW